MGKVSGTKGMCVSGVICLMGEGKMCTMKHDWDAHLSSPEILKVLIFVKTGDSLLMSVMKFPTCFTGPQQDCHCSTAIYSNFCQMGEGVTEIVMDWLNGLVADFHGEGIVKPV
jgi:hypothetical protein